MGNQFEHFVCFFYGGKRLNKSIDIAVLTPSVATAHYDVVVMGAGPYGLSIAAHLLGRGLKVAVFGKTMDLWHNFMPKGMLLRSYWWATHLSDPQQAFGLDRYLHEQGLTIVDPVPGETIATYGDWFQKHAVPTVDPTFIQTIERKEEHFEVTLVDGRVVICSSVVMAPGLQPYVYRAPEYDHLPKELVFHTAELHTFDALAGKKVAMIGGGQSALESSALAYESGVQMELFSRKALVWIKSSAAFPEHRTLFERLYAPKAGIAAGWFNRIEETFPYSFPHLPQRLKDRFLGGVAAHGPMGSSWLKPRLIGKVPLHERVSVLQAQEADDGVLLTLSTNQTMKFDKLILATGYRVDLKRLAILGKALLPQIKAYNGAPVLNDRFESSVPGLYFVGFSSYKSCGAYYRFVVGVGATARRVAGTIAQRTPVGKRL